MPNRHFQAWAADALTVTILELWARVGKSLRWFRGWREDYRESSKAAFGRPRGTQEEPKTSPRGSKRAQEEPKRKARAQEDVDNIIFGKSPAAKKKQPRGSQKEPMRSQEDPRGAQEEPKRSREQAKRSPRRAKRSPRGSFLEPRSRKYRSQCETHKNARKKRVLECLRGAQEQPKRSQEEAKRSPRGAKRRQRGTQEQSKRKFFGAPKPKIQVPGRDPQKRS